MCKVCEEKEERSMADQTRGRGSRSNEKDKKTWLALAACWPAYY